MTRPPDRLVRSTRRAVAGGTSYCSGYGSSSASSEETPQCSVIGAIVTPRVTSSVTTAGLNGLAALGISALPYWRPKIVWYASSGHGCAAYEYLIGWPYRTRYGSTATESFACHSRAVARPRSSSSAPPGSGMTLGGDTRSFGIVDLPCGIRGSISQVPSGRAVPKWIVRPGPAGTAAGRVFDVLTTSRSPGSSSRGRSVNR